MRRFASLLVSSCLIVIVSSTAFGQQQATVVHQGGNVIGAEDGVALVVADVEELTKTWRVSAAGDLNLPMVGQIHAEGMTVESLQAELTERLKLYVRDPQVTAYIAEYRSQPVTVQGAVAKPGTIQTEGSKTLLDVLMMAGGANSSGPAVAGPTVTVTRTAKYGSIPLPEAKVDPIGKFSTVELKLKDATNPTSAAANLLIRPYDVVSVSARQRLVYVIGQVNRPGAVELDTQDTVSVMQVLAAAGGLTNLAAPANTAIMHVDSEGKYIPVASVNLKHVMGGKAEDKMLSPGDIIVVPENRIKSYTQSAVNSATSYGLYALIIGKF
jgi:protein involved in polysaccharide export with SLBB domain